MLVGLAEQRGELYQRFADLVAAPRQGGVDGAEGGVEFVRLQVGEHGDQLLVHGVELDDHMIGGDHLTAAQCALGPFLGNSQVDRLRTEDGVDLISAVTLAGIDDIWSESISSFRIA